MSVEHIQKSVTNVIDYLTENPNDARATSDPIVAVMEDGLRCRATGPNGRSIVTDMPQAVGGGDAAPSPGWLSNAALATCDATRIALQAAHQGIKLDVLEVSVQATSDDRGLFAMDSTVPAGPLNVRTSVRIGAAGVSSEILQQIVDHSVVHSPIADKCRRAIPTEVAVEIVQ